MSKLKVTTIANADDTANVSTDAVVNGVLRAWVDFASPAGTINSSYNVSSVTNHATGDNTINFTNAMPNINYGFTFGGGRTDSASAAGSIIRSMASNKLVGSMRLWTGVAGTAADYVTSTVAIFGPKA